MHDEINSDTVELARYNESLYNEILARYKNDFLYPSNSKVYEKQRPYNGTSLSRTNFASAFGPSLYRRSTVLKKYA